MTKPPSLIFDEFDLLDCLIIFLFTSCAKSAFYGDCSRADTTSNSSARFVAEAFSIGIDRHCARWHRFNYLKKVIWGEGADGCFFQTIKDGRCCSTVQPRLVAAIILLRLFSLGH